jgi:hypothetical protein
MKETNPGDLPAEGCLKTLGIKSFREWDVLVFLYRHSTSLVSAEHIARLLGYPTGEVFAALDSLEPLGLVERTRASQGVRLYQLRLPSDSPRGAALGWLTTFADSRDGRLSLAKKLQRGERPEATSGHSRFHGKGRIAWPKAI